MSRSFSQLKLISGVALISAFAVGCGGGSSPATGGGSTNGGTNGAVGLNEGSTSCAAVTAPETLSASNGALIGSCEQYEASVAPTKAATAFKSPGINSPVIYSPVSGYAINLPVLAAGTTTIPLTNLLTLPGGAIGYTFGNFAGNTYQTILDASNGAAATAYEYANTRTITGQKFLDLTYSRFGMFSRFGNRTLGYYGGWAQGSSVGNLPTGSVTFRGALVGVIGPGVGSTNGGTAAGYSADISITVNFAAPGAPITSLALSNFGYSANGSQISTVAVASGGVVSASSLDVGTKSLSAVFTTTAAGTTNAIAEGRMSGSFYGAAGVADASEFVGTLKFRTADGRNAVGAFGVRTGTSIVNP
jgi:hypothetical protein